jgi:hypothetical protein
VADEGGKRTALPRVLVTPFAPLVAPVSLSDMFKGWSIWLVLEAV